MKRRGSWASPGQKKDTNWFNWKKNLHKKSKERSAERTISSSGISTPYKKNELHHIKTDKSLTPSTPHSNSPSHKATPSKANKVHSSPSNSSKSRTSILDHFPPPQPTMIPRPPLPLTPQIQTSQTSVKKNITLFWMCIFTMATQSLEVSNVCSTS